MKASRTLDAAAVLILAATFIPQAVRAQSDVRKYLVRNPDTVFAIGSLNDRVLIDPIRVAADDSMVVAFDAAFQAVKAFSMTGELLWSFGRRGAGPGEFRNVRDIALGSSGEVLVVDQTNQRLTVVDRAGRLVKEIPLVRLGGSPEQVLQLAADEYLIWGLVPREPPLAFVNAQGEIRKRMEPPFEIAPKIPFLGSQAKLANEPNFPDRWIYAFAFADRWRVMHGEQPASQERTMVETAPLPEVEFEDRGRAGFSSRLGAVTFTALSVAVRGDTVFVLYGGQTDEQNRIVDLYRASTGRYEGTVLLPHRASRMAIGGQLIVVLEREEIPRLVGFRWGS